MQLNLSPSMLPGRVMPNLSPCYHLDHACFHVCKPPADVKVQRRPPVSQVPGTRASCGLGGHILAFARCTFRSILKQLLAQKHEGLHPPRKLAAKATWLWGLVGKQGTEASLCDIDSSHHLHGGACHCLSAPVIAQPGRHFILQCRHVGLKLYAEKPLGYFRSLPFHAPNKSRNKVEGPTEASQAIGIDYHVRSQLSFLWQLSVQARSNCLVPILDRAGKHKHAAYSVHQMGPQQILSEVLTRGIGVPRLSCFVTGAP